MKMGSAPPNADSCRHVGPSNMRAAGARSQLRTLERGIVLPIFGVLDELPTSVAASPDCAVSHRVRDRTMRLSGYRCQLF